MKVDPEDFKDGAGDDDGVEPVERRGEEGAGAQGIHSNIHLKDKGTKEQEFCVNWKQKQEQFDTGFKFFYHFLCCGFPNCVDLVCKEELKSYGKSNRLLVKVRWA